MNFQRVTSSLPELFYDVISIFIPGFYLCASLFLLANHAGIPRPERIVVVSPIFDAIAIIYLSGHIIYSLSSLVTAKFFSFVLGKPQHFLLLNSTKKRHRKAHDYLFLGSPQGPDFLSRVVENGIRDLTSNDRFLLQKQNVNDAYEYCRNYVMEHASRRATAIRKEQAYGEMARGFVLVSFLSIALYAISYSAGRLENTIAVWIVATVHTLFLLSSIYRYSQARLINPLFVYMTFGVLSEGGEVSVLSTTGAVDSLIEKSKSTMNKTKVTFNLDHGQVEGVYMEADEPDAPLVIVTNGHNGFYNYGMFPRIQDLLAESGISSYSYNFSHGGVEGDSDYFTELEKYEKNCMRLETADLVGIIRNLDDSSIRVGSNTDLFLLSHSLGNVPTIFGTREALEENFSLAGLVLIAPIKTLDVWPEEMIEEWEANGVYYMKNNRTGQDLPQGKEFLKEVKKADSEWSVENATKDVDIDCLIVHGEDDSDVPVEHAKAVQQWASDNGNDAALEIIADADHTFKTEHPSKRSSPELEEAVSKITDWIDRKKH